MRATLIAAAAAAAVSIPSVAEAAGGPDLTEWMDVGTFELGALASVTTEIDLTGSDFRVVGFELRFDYFEPVVDASWASDLQLHVTAPSGASYTVGGLSNQPDSNELWSFNGPGSDAAGHYGDDGRDIFVPWDLEPEDADDFDVRLVNDWAGDQFVNRYEMVQIRFYTVPAIACPGDVDDDETVDFADLILLLKAWGECPGCPEDINGDGNVDFQDLVELLYGWGGC